MPHLITIPIGVVVAREQIDHAWQEVRWRPVTVFMDAPPQTGPWRELLRGESYVHYHAATLLLELHRTETMSYQINLANGEPSVYVVMRDTEEQDESAPPVEPYLVTISPFEAQAHGESAFEFVERVTMPDQLIEIIESFINEHHVETPFKKRKRERHSDEDAHQFGQEPVFELRERMKGKGKKSGSDDET